MREAAHIPKPPQRYSRFAGEQALAKIPSTHPFLFARLLNLGGAETYFPSILAKNPPFRKIFWQHQF